jgi:hypothetical protein
MKRWLANLLSHWLLLRWVWPLYPRRLKVWLFLNAD